MPTERDFVDDVFAAAADRITFLRQTLALGLMVVDKWDRTDNDKNNLRATPELISIIHFTDREAAGFISEADLLMRDYVSGIAIASAPLKSRSEWWWEVWQGVVAAFCYSLLLILLAIVVRLGGHDLIDILREAIKP